MTTAENLPDVDDDLMTALIPLAERMIGAVHALDADEVGALFAEAGHLAGDQLAAARALTVLLAAWCSEDHVAVAALGWTEDPARYREFRETTDALTASLRCSRSRHVSAVASTSGGGG